MSHVTLSAARNGAQWSEPHRYGVWFGHTDIAFKLAGVFVILGGDLADIGVGAAFHLRWASLTVLPHKDAIQNGQEFLARSCFSIAGKFR